MREADPDFADVDLALGRYALDIPQQPDQDEALRRFTSARAAFSESPAIVASLGLPRASGAARRSVPPRRGATKILRALRALRG